MRNLQLFLYQLNRTLEALLPGEDDNSVVAQDGRPVDLELSRNKINDYRQLIQHHHICLQSAMLLLQIHMLSQISSSGMMGMRSITSRLDSQPSHMKTGGLSAQETQDSKEVTDSTAPKVI